MEGTRTGRESCSVGEVLWEELAKHRAEGELEPAEWKG